MSLKTRIQDKFDWDVSALPAYTDEQSQDFFLTLLDSSSFLSKLQLDEGVKGSKEIKLLTADMSLQAYNDCTPTPDGAAVFTGDTLTTKPLYAGIKFCNEDLNDKYTQMLNVLGIRRQNQQMVLEDVLLAYLEKLMRKKIQDAVLLGDTASANPDLVHFDGLVKLIDNNADVIDATVSLSGSSTGIDATNGFDFAKAVYNAVPSEVFDNQMNVVILTGRQEARAIIDQVYNDKDYASTLDNTDENGVISFTLPTTNITVETVPQLNGLGKMYGFVYNLAFLGTDLESELDGLDIKYHDYDDELKAEAKFRLGTQIVYGQYFVKLVIS